MKTQKFKFMGASLFLAFAAMMLLVFACSPAKTWTVTVDPSGGTAASTSYSVENGGTVDIPAPSKDGYVFNGWTTSSGGTTADFVPNSTAVTSDVTIYAIWLKGHTVTINTNGGTPATITKIVGDGLTLTLSGADIPTNSAKYVTGIKEYRDGNNNLFEMGKTLVTDNMNLRVRWSVNLNVIWNMLNPDAPNATKWSKDTNTYITFTKTTNPNELSYSDTKLGSNFSNGKTTVTENDRIDFDYIVKIAGTSAFDYIKAISDNAVTFSAVSVSGIELSASVYTR